VEATHLLLEGSSETQERIAELIVTRRQRVGDGKVPWAMGRLGLEDAVLTYMASERADHDKLGLYVMAT
jgi:hypothetical protein